MLHMDAAYQPDLEKTVCSLRRRNMTPTRLDSALQALEWVKRRIPPGAAVAVGGSNTLRQIGVMDYIENGDFRYTSRYVKGQHFQLDDTIAPEVLRQSYLEAFSADYYLTSANAVTEEGELVNVDGQGNRVAALAYGPKEVIVIAGRNKIVRSRAEAFERLGRIISCGGMGQQRGFCTPCMKVGRCVDCRSPERRCCTYSITGFQPPQPGQQRLQVLLVDQPLGF